LMERREDLVERLMPELKSLALGTSKEWAAKIACPCKYTALSILGTWSQGYKQQACDTWVNLVQSSLEFYVVVTLGTSMGSLLASRALFSRSEYQRRSNGAYLTERKIL
jgi:hypothetical protein